MDVDSVIYPQIKIQKEEIEYDATEPLPTSIQLFYEAFLMVIDAIIKHILRLLDIVL